MRHLCSCLAGCLLLLPILATGADPDPHPNPSSATDSLSAANPHGADLRALIGEVAARTHKHFVIDPRAPQSVDIEGLEPREVTYPQLQSILQVYGLVVAPGDGILEIVPNADSRQLPVPLVRADSILTPDNEYVTTIIVLKNASAAQLVPILRPLIPQYGHLAALPDRNALLLADRSANVRRVVEIARALDALPKWPEYTPPKAADRP